MKAIHRTNHFKDNYEIVDIIKCPISEKNQWAHIKKRDGEEKYTGGILVTYDETTENILKTMTHQRQWEWLISIRVQPCI